MLIVSRFPLTQPNTELVRFDFVLISLLLGNDYLPKLRGANLARLWLQYRRLKTGAFRGQYLLDPHTAQRAINGPFFAALLKPYESILPANRGGGRRGPGPLHPTPGPLNITPSPVNITPAPAMTGAAPAPNALPPPAFNQAGAVAREVDSELELDEHVAAALLVRECVHVVCICAHALVFLCECVRMCIWVHVRVHMCLFLGVPVRVHMCLYARECTCVCVCHVHACSLHLFALVFFFHCLLLRVFRWRLLGRRR